MAFMSGTLEGLLLYGVSRQSQGGEPAATDCRKPGNQTRNVTYTDAQLQSRELTMVQSEMSRKSRMAVRTHSCTQAETSVYDHKTRLPSQTRPNTQPLGTIPQAETPIFSNEARMAVGSISQAETSMFSNEARLSVGSHTQTQPEISIYGNSRKSSLTAQAGGMHSPTERLVFSSGQYAQESDSCGADSDNTSDLVSTRCGSDIDTGDRKKAHSAIIGRRETVRSMDEATWNHLDCLDPDPELQDWSMASTDLTSTDQATADLTPGGLDSGNSNMSLMGCSSVNSDSLTQDLYTGAGLQETQSFLRATEETPTSRQGTSDAQLVSKQSVVGEAVLRNIAQSRRDLSPFYQSQSRHDSESPSRHKMLSEQCFQAAISEGFGSCAQSYTQKVRPGKRFSYHVHNRLTGTNKHVGMEHHHKTQQWDQTFPQSPSETSDILKMALSDTVSTVNSGIAPSSSGFHESQDGSSSDTSSQTSRKDGFGRKYRYNHTALALQQSGLMKTTIKTAEILHRGKILQAELNKLRKETALFMRSVLSNPENQHFRELYLKLHHSKLIN